MQYIRQLMLGSLLIGGWIPQDGLSKTVALMNAKGEKIEWEVTENDKFLDVLDQIQFHLQEGQTTCSIHDIQLKMTHAGVALQAKKADWRNYDLSATKQDKKDITFIVTTLANDSLVSIASSRSSLKKAGDRIDPIHPLRFLLTVFRSEELKAGIHAIRDRGGWIWSGFRDGLLGSVKEETHQGNLLQFVPDFSNKLDINPDMILPYLKEGKWNDFLDVLIDKIPRQNDPNRYNM